MMMCHIPIKLFYKFSPIIMTAVMMVLFQAYSALGESIYPNSNVMNPFEKETEQAKDKSYLLARPDVIGLRVIYGQIHHITAPKQQSLVKEASESLYGSAIALEWAFFDHHIEFEVILGGFEHTQTFDEFAEAVVKVPYHFGHHFEVLLGVGGVLETYHQHLEYGVGGDINTRYWLDQSWGLSTEFDYVRFNTGTNNTELIAEVLYRF